MLSHETTELLSLHAAALNGGQDLARALTDSGTVAPHSETAGLLELAAQVKAVLAHPLPRPAFVAELSTQLLTAHRALSTAPASPPKRFTLWLAIALGVGSLLTALLAILGWRLSRHPLTKPHAAH